MAQQQWTAADVPDQTGRTAVITGANSGIGFETAKVLAARGATVVLAVRDIGKGEQAAAGISGDVRVRRLDLTSLAAIRTTADHLRDTLPRIDLLINNAGVMNTPLIRTADGFELQLGTNHLGHFAFTGLLLDMLLPVEGSRVVTVSSTAHRGPARINFDDLNSEKSYGGVAAYRQSKLANLMFTYELQRRLSGKGKTIAVAAHPGASSTGLMRNSPAILRGLFTVLSPIAAQSAEMGALPTLRAATDPTVLGGQYYGPSGFREAKGHPQVVKSTERSHDVAVQRRLWTVSEEMTGVKFPV